MPGDLLISYIQGESVVGIFNQQERPMLVDDLLVLPTILTNRIGRITQWKQPAEGLQFSLGQHTWIKAKINPAIELAQKEHAKEKTRTLEEMLPECYYNFKDVFEKKASERFPEPRPYDHVIDLKPDFVPKNCKVYPLSPKEQTALDNFLEENLRKGYI